MQWYKKKCLPYQTCLELKALGFDEPCVCWHMNYGKEFDRWLHPFEGCKNSRMPEDGVAAPTMEDALAWFREKHKLFGTVNWYKSKHGLVYNYEIFGMELPKDDETGEKNDVREVHPRSGYDNMAYDSDEYETYEEAQVNCVIELIQMIKE